MVTTLPAVAKMSAIWGSWQQTRNHVSSVTQLINKAAAQELLLDTLCAAWETHSSLLGVFNLQGKPLNLQYHFADVRLSVSDTNWLQKGERQQAKKPPNIHDSPITSRLTDFMSIKHITSLFPLQSGYHTHTKTSQLSTPSPCQRRYLQSNHILAVDFTDVVLCQKPVSRSRTVFHYRGYFAILEYETNVPGAVLMHSDNSFKRPVKNTFKMQTPVLGLLNHRKNHTHHAPSLTYKKWKTHNGSYNEKQLGLTSFC